MDYEILIHLTENIGKYYDEKPPEPKMNEDGTPKLRNGVPQYRIITPSNGLLKTTQDKIKTRILRKIDRYRASFSRI